MRHFFMGFENFKGFFHEIFPRDFSTIQISSFTLDIYLIAASISAIFGGKIQISTNKQNETLWMISNLFLEITLDAYLVCIISTLTLNTIELRDIPQ